MPSAQGTDAGPPHENLADYCARVDTDDTLREYAPGLRERTMQALRQLSQASELDLPGLDAAQDDSALDSYLGHYAKFRCMYGRVMVCAIGADHPCDKLDKSQGMSRVTRFCQDYPNDDNVGLSVAGHDSLYEYRCRDGRAEIIGGPWRLDARGFADVFWTALPDPSRTTKGGK